MLEWIFELSKTSTWILKIPSSSCKFHQTSDTKIVNIWGWFTSLMHLFLRSCFFKVIKNLFSTNLAFRQAQPVGSLGSNCWQNLCSAKHGILRCKTTGIPSLWIEAWGCKIEKVSISLGSSFYFTAYMPSCMNISEALSANNKPQTSNVRSGFQFLINAPLGLQ